MSLMLPDLHDRLVEAAAHPPRRVPQVARRVAPLLLALLVLMLLVTGLAGDPKARSGTSAVPDSTLAKALALSQAPSDAPPIGTLTPPKMREYVAGLVAELPYPPDAVDDLQSQVRPFSSGADMGSIDRASDARRLGEYRAWCTWQLFWLRSSSEDRAAATRVLQTIGEWPTFRGSQIGERASEIGQAATAGDTAAIAEESRLNCASVR